MKISLKETAAMHADCLSAGFSDKLKSDLVESAYRFLAAKGNDTASINLAAFLLQRSERNAAAAVPVIAAVVEKHKEDLYCASILSTALTFANRYQESALVVKDMLANVRAHHCAVYVSTPDADKDFAVVKAVADDLVEVDNVKKEMFKDAALRKLHSGSEEWWYFKQAFDVDLPMTREIAEALLFQIQFTGLPLSFVLYNLTVDKNRDLLKRLFTDITRGLPEKYIVSPPRIFSDIGILIDNRLFNWATLKDQDHIAELYNHGVFDYFAETGKPVSILEIGSGYAGVALHLSNIMKPRRHLLVDLPSTLGFAASYVRKATGKDAGHIPFFTGTNKKILDKADMVMVPNFLCDKADGEIDFAINTGSFGEMTQDQVAFYISFMDKNLSDHGLVYEHNSPNAHGRFDIKAMIAKSFRGTVINIDNNERIWCRPGVEEKLRTLSAGKPQTSFSRSAPLGTGFPFPVLALSPQVSLRNTWQRAKNKIHRIINR